MARTVLVDTPDGEMGVYLDEPARTGSGARVILMYPRSGMDGFPQRIARWLSANGHPVACPDITHRCSAEMPIRDRKAHLKDKEILRDVAALIAFLRQRDGPSVPLAVMGHCMGGRHAFLVAACLREIDGAAVYYSGDMMEGWGRAISPFELLGLIGCPVIGFFGGQDRNPSPADVDRIESELARTGVVHRFHRYGAVGHGFQQNAERSPQERAAADHSSAETLMFLRGLEPAIRHDDGRILFC